MSRRGGIEGAPDIQRLTVTDAAAVTVALPLQCKFLQVSNDGAVACRLFESQADADANTGFIELAATTGYFEGPWGQHQAWLRLAAVGSQTVALIAYGG